MSSVLLFIWACWLCLGVPSLWTLNDEPFKEHCIHRDMPVSFIRRSRWARNDNGYSLGIFSLSQTHAWPCTLHSALSG